MVKVENYLDAVRYVNRLGFAGTGVIAYRQKTLCKIADLIRAGHTGEIQHVRFHKGYQHGQWTIWRGVFEVHDESGEVRYIRVFDGVRLTPFEFRAWLAWRGGEVRHYKLWRKG